MKIGFSSAVCPAWDLETMVRNAAQWGYNGIELRGLQGELRLPLARGLASAPENVKALFAENKVELVCIGSSVTLTSKDRREIGRQRAILEENLELAHRLGCPMVRIFSGEVEKLDTQRAALSRAAEHLARVAPLAGRLGVSIVVENGGDFPSSADLWFLLDAVDHPSVRACWNQCHAMAILERATVSLPRLGSKLGLVHLCDGDFDGQGVLMGYKPLGEGNAETAKQVELLKGLIYRGYLMFEWPKLWVESLPGPETVLPAGAKYLQAQIQAKQPVLSAYKGDKNAPKFTKVETAAAPV